MMHFCLMVVYYTSRFMQSNGWIWVGLISLLTCQLGQKRAAVARPRSCTLCRECIRGDDWDKLVALRRVKDHFICK